MPVAMVFETTLQSTGKTAGVDSTPFSSWPFLFDRDSDAGFHF
jgi:hypothetical protein